MNKEEIDWDKANEMLDKACKIYTEIGSLGLPALTVVILPLRDRLRKQLKTKELYDDILNVYNSL